MPVFNSIFNTKYQHVIKHRDQYRNHYKVLIKIRQHTNYRTIFPIDPTDSINTYTTMIALLRWYQNS